MSNYQSPYTPPGDFDSYPLAWPPQMLLPARRAALLMYILAALALAVGSIFFLGSMAPLDQLAPDQRQALEEFAAQNGWSVKACFIAAGATMTTSGLILGGLGLFVRRGTLVPIVMAIVLDVLMLMVVGITILRTATSGQPNELMAIWPPVGAGVIMAFLMGRLVAAAKSNRQAKAMQSQYWQSQPPGDSRP